MVMMRGLNRIAMLQSMNDEQLAALRPSTSMTEPHRDGWPDAGRTSARAESPWLRWRAPALLLALCIVPVGAGIARLIELASGGPVTPENKRFFFAPLPVVFHVISVGLYCILGALQLPAGVRRRFPHWHQASGIVSAPAGMIAVLTGLWMQATYALPANDGFALAVQRVLVGTAMMTFLVLGLLKLRKRRFAQHGAYMLRAYALGMGAGTQVLTHIAHVVLAGEPDLEARAWLMGSAWLANLSIAEWVIHRRPSRLQRPPAHSAPGVGRGLAVLVLFLLGIGAPAVRADEGSDRTRDAPHPDLGGALHVHLPLLRVEYATDTSLLLGLETTLTQQYEPGASARESQVFMAAAGTLRGHYRARVRPQLFLQEDHIHIDADLSLSRLPEGFLGLGNQRSSTSVGSYTPVLQELTAHPKWRLLPGLYIGPRLRLLHVQLVDVDTEVRAALASLHGANGGLSVEMGLGLMWDTRDRTLYPRRGGLVLASASTARRAFWSDFKYHVLQVDGRHYWPMPFLQAVLATRASLQLQFGDAPFYDTSALGGNGVLRGYQPRRFTGRHALAGQVELRVPLFWRLGAAAFVAAGAVAQRLDDVHLDGFRMAGGVGLRFKAEESMPINIRLDVAYGSELNAYLAVGEAF